MTTILEESKHFVSNLLKDNLEQKLYFHNLDHTISMVNAVIEIGSHSKLSKDEMEMLQIAAWFHDTGYTIDYYSHEEKSCEIAEDFLSVNKYPQKKINIVKNLILKTHIEATAETLLEKIMKDADLAHLKKKSAFKFGAQLRKELAFHCSKEFSDQEWVKYEHHFYNAVQYHTEYAQQKWQPGIALNREKLDGLLKDIEAGREPVIIPKKKKKQSGLSEKELKQLAKIKTTERGVETVFRTTSRNHLKLSQMADTKANTLISISAVLISLTSTFLANNLDVQTHLILPTSIMLVACVVTIIFATLSTRPTVTKNTLTRKDIENRRGNLLFFGNFYSMPLKDFEWGMEEMMQDRNYLYGNLKKDIYFLGIVLARKYKFLTTAYSVFMYGIIISVISLLFALHYNQA